MARTNPHSGEPRAARAWLLPAAMVVLASFAALPSAHAHPGGSQQEYESTVLSVEPEGVPVRARVLGGDDELLVENRGDRELLLYGYEASRDPYVRIGPRGVFVNRNSTAFYLNKGRYGSNPPEGTGLSGRPKWTLVRRRPASYAFHDHRVHWMDPRREPPSVDTGDPSRQKVYDWEVPFRYGDTEGLVKGRLDYVGGRAWWQALLAPEWVLTATAVAAMLVVFGVELRRRRRRSKAHRES